MVKLLWRLLPDDDTRMVAAVVVGLVVMLTIAYGFVVKVYKHKYHSNAVRWCAVSGSVILFGIEIIVAFKQADNYWINLGIKEYLDNQYDLFILMLMFTVVIYTVNKIIHIILEAIWEIKNWRVSLKSEYIYKLFQIVCFLVLTRVELIKMRSIYNNEDGGYDKVYLMFATYAFLGINILLAYGFKKLKMARQYEKEIALMRVQNELQLEKYMALNNRYEESGKIIHDIRKHLDIMESLMDKDDEKARAYGNQISDEISRQMNLLAAGFNCSNSILSVIMSQKITEAEDKNIKVDVDMIDIDLDFIEDIDITAIFANLWDNAIEASMKIDENERHIDVVVGRMMDFIIISFENSFDGSIKTDGENLVSSKGEQHGFGLRIIESAVKKYKGQFKTEAEKGIFKSKVIIPVDKV